MNIAMVSRRCEFSHVVLYFEQWKTAVSTVGSRNYVHDGPYDDSHGQDVLEVPIHRGPVSAAFDGAIEWFFQAMRAFFMPLKILFPFRFVFTANNVAGIRGFFRMDHSVAPEMRYRSCSIWTLAALVRSLHLRILTVHLLVQLHSVGSVVFVITTTKLAGFHGIYLWWWHPNNLDTLENVTLWRFWSVK